MDDILNWHIWMYVAILFFIIELFTPGFIVACLGLGSIAGALSAYLGFDIDYQLISFAVVTTISLFIIRPLLYKKNKSGDLIKTNTDALIGRKAKVVEQIDNKHNKGRVSIDGDQWKALSTSEHSINKGEIVEVVSIDSTIVTVKNFK